MASCDPNDLNEPPSKRTGASSKADTSEFSPDTEEHVVQQTDGVFRSFVYHLYTMFRTRQEADDTPNVSELTNLSDSPFSSAARVGRQLAIIGDTIDSRHTNDFNNMIRDMNLTPESAYEAFAGVARKLFKDGINWGRIVTLLCFGYRMAVTVIQRGVHGFFSHIVSFVVKFILTEKIAKWIADQGGWRAVLFYQNWPVDWSTISIIASMAAVSILAAIFLSRKS